LTCFTGRQRDGARLGKLVELINEHGLASVSALDARYAGTVGRGPWVAAIAITRLDKPAVGLGYDFSSGVTAQYSS
jgi:hypothetical protein